VIGRGSLWGIRFLALVIALLLWFFVSLQRREQQSEKVIDASITYNLPTGTTLVDPVQDVRIRLRGKTSRIRSLNQFAVDVVVNVPEGARGPVEVQLSADNVVVPEDIEVASIEPNRLLLQIDREVQRSLPVKVKLMGEPAAGAVVGEVAITPDEALVSGPESRLRDLRWLTTSNVNLNGHALDFEETAVVVSPDPLVRVLRPTMVTVRVPMQPPAIGESRPREKSP